MVLTGLNCPNPGGGLEKGASMGWNPIGGGMVARFGGMAGGRACIGGIGRACIGGMGRACSGGMGRGGTPGGPEGGTPGGSPGGMAPIAGMVIRPTPGGVTRLGGS